MKRTIMHIDMDAFFASVEQLDRPELRGKPVIVGADPKVGRGVVSAASYEARKFGVHSAQPITQAFRLCPEGVFLRPRFSRYKELSEKIFAILDNISPDIEPISVDEAFVDLTGTERIHGDPIELARSLKARIFKETGLIASIGIAPNKFLAKLASDIGKPNGFVVVEENKVHEFLEPLPIRALWGVGEKSEKSLLKLGIKTIGELARLPKEILKAKFGVYGETIWRLANGIDEREVAPVEKRKGISVERTYDRDEDRKAQKIATLRYIADRLARRMLAENIIGQTITVKIRYADFTTISRSSTQPMKISTAEDIYEKALKLAEPCLDGSIRLLGIRISNLVECGDQLELFDERKNEKIKRLEKALDEIQEKFGNGAIGRGIYFERDEEK